jgi:hypothetical protein
VRVLHARGFPVRTVTLGGGQRAYFTFIFTSSGPCPPHFLSAYGLKVTPPGDARSLRLSRFRFDLSAACRSAVIRD